MQKLRSQTGFTAFDTLSGGLTDGATYLVYGPSGTGKSAFALAFLHQGLVHGETVALVTGQAPEVLLRLASGLGIELDPFVDSGQLIMLDYSDNMDDKLSRLFDPAEIVGEFQSFLGATPLRRLVLDPITPLLGSAGAAHCRSVVQAFALLEATCMFVADTTTEERVLADCKNCVHGILHFSDSRPGHPTKVLALEKFPEVRDGANEVRFEVKTGFGLLEAATSVEHIPAPRPFATHHQRPRTTTATPSIGSFDRLARILIIHPDRDRRTKLREQLAGEGTILEAHGAADGLGMVTVENPDLIIISLTLRGVTGFDVARKIRQNGRNTPILAIGLCARRSADNVRALEAGIDHLLGEPANRVELLGRVLSMLTRTGVLPLNYISQRLRMAERPANQVTSTTDFETFRNRVREEAEFSQKQAADMVLFAIRSPQGPVSVEEMSAVISLTARERDLLYVGANGVAGLLLECAHAGPFLARFRQRWQGVAPSVTELVFDGSETFVERACAIAGEVAGFEVGPAEARIHAA